MKTAIVHPWFLEAGGGERVADVLGGMFPDADVFTYACDPRFLPPALRNRKITVSALNWFMIHGGSLRNYMFPAYPWAAESFDLSSYDLVISSCPPVMGVNVRQDATHVCYCHTTQHSWWDLYAEHQAKLSPLKRHIFVKAAVFQRMWEFNAVQRMDRIAVNSQYVAERTFKYFRRQASVIYPPVNTSMGYLAPGGDDYYLTVSRLTASKRIDILIEACNRLKRRLLIVGTGRSESQLKSMAGPTIEFCGGVSDEALPSIYARSRAFLFAADEDFGIAPVEAQSFGRPVIAYGKGGSLETARVSDASGLSDTGVFFFEQTVDSVVDALQRFEATESSFKPADIQQHARKFDTSVFLDRFSSFVHSALRDGQRDHGGNSI